MFSNTPFIQLATSKDDDNPYVISHVNDFMSRTCESDEFYITMSYHTISRTIIFNAFTECKQHAFSLSYNFIKGILKFNAKDIEYEYSSSYLYILYKKHFDDKLLRIYFIKTLLRYIKNLKRDKPKLYYQHFKDLDKVIFDNHAKPELDNYLCDDVINIIRDYI